MKKMSNFVPIRLGFIAVFIVIPFLAAIPHTAMVRHQPLLVSTPNYFHAEYRMPAIQDSAPTPSDKPHVMAASYYNLQGTLKSSISLNNKGLLPLEVKPTLFNLDGERLDVPPVTVEATSFRVFDLAEWAEPGGPAFQQGSLQLFYRGKDLLLGAQVKITDPASSIIFDEQLSEPKAMISSRLEGLWWLPSDDSHVSIVISNTTNSTQTALLEVGGVEPNQRGSKELTLKPHQTILIDPAQDFSDKPIDLMKTGGISIRHSGEPGDLIARAMIQDSSAGFSSVVQLADPKKAKSSSLHGAGLRLGEIAGEELSAVVVARNISEKAAVLRGRIPHAKDDGSIDVFSLREVKLIPGEVKQWEIKEARGLKGSAGLEFDYDTEPGSVIVSALSVSKSKNHVFQVPMLDITVQKSSTGVYPFYFYGSSSTVVYIKNTTAVEQKYVCHMNFEGGNYMMGVRTIAPGETMTIDIRALRDNQVLDQEQRAIPHNVAHGQVRWTIIQSEGTDLLALIGRSEQVDEVKAVSSTYACQNCCGDLPQSVFISPSQVDMQVGQSIAMSAFEQRVDCYGFPYLVQVSASWSSNNSSVATVSGGQVTPQRAGQATIMASWNSFNSVPTQCGPGFGPPPIEPTTCCGSRSFIRSASATVRVIPRVTISSAQTIMDGSTANFSIQSPDATPSSIAWSFTAPTGAGNNPNVTFNPANGTSTQTNGRWFAFPNTECPNTNCQSTYNISCAVDFSLGFAVRVTVNTSLTVDGCWSPAGAVAPPVISGGPTIGFDPSRNLWVVINSGTLSRNLQSRVINVSPTSQFFFKTSEHERVHEQQYATGMLSDIRTVSSLMVDLLPITDPTEAGLRAKINNAAVAWANSQSQLIQGRRSAFEREAYSVSDLIAPRYLYQNCGRF